MSQEHVDVMNERLHGLMSVRDACQDLDGYRVMQFHLRTEDRRPDVFWVLEYTDTLQLSLARYPAPDVDLTGSWLSMMTAVAAGRAGRFESPGLELRGDTELFTRLNAIFEAARTAITVTTHLPLR